MANTKWEYKIIYPEYKKCDEGIDIRIRPVKLYDEEKEFSPKYRRFRTLRDNEANKYFCHIKKNEKEPGEFRKEYQKKGKNERIRVCDRSYKRKEKKVNSCYR